jgi:hypothetical protein
MSQDTLKARQQRMAADVTALLSSRETMARWSPDCVRMELEPNQAGPGFV